MESTESINMLVRAISEYGILVFIAVIFLWDKVANSRTLNKVVIELQKSVALQTASLESLNHSNTSLNVAVNVIKELVTDGMHQQKEHYLKTDYMNKDVKETVEIIRWMKERLVSK